MSSTPSSGRRTGAVRARLTSRRSSPSDPAAGAGRDHRRAGDCASWRKLPALGLEVVERHTSATTTFALRGELDLFASPSLLQVVRRALRRRPAVLRVDLRHVEFLDITGARALIRCRGLAFAAQADFELLAPSDPVRRLLEVSRLQTVFETHPDAA